MQHTYYFYLSTFVKKKWYFYYSEIHSARYLYFFHLLFCTQWFVRFCLSETSTKALSQDSFSAIKRSHSQRLTLFHQSNGARRSHDRIQALRGLVQKRASVWLKAVNNGGKQRCAILNQKRQNTPGLTFSLFTLQSMKKNSYVMRCQTCPPKLVDISAYMNSTSNLRKHVAVSCLPVSPVISS